MSSSIEQSTPSPTCAEKKYTKKQTFFRRLLSTLILWTCVAAAFYFNHPLLWFGLILLVVIGALVEFFQLFPGHGFERFRWHCYLLGGIYIAALFSGSLPFMPRLVAGADLDGFVVAALIISIVLTRLRSPLEGQKTLHEIAVSVFGLLYIVFLFGFVVKILLLPYAIGQGEARTYLIYLLAVTKFTDMGAYSIGSLIGKNKMVPNVSPGKTWQGFGGAILGAFIASYGCLWIMGERIGLITPLVAGALALALALVAILGDLAESILKRSLQVKDSGHIFPGIGGILDLIDSILFTAPVLYFFLKFLMTQG